MEEQPAYSASPEASPQPSSPKRKWLKPVLIAGVVLVAAVVVVTVVLLAKSDKKSTEDAPKTQNSLSGSKNFKMTTDGAAVTYAGQPVYDACGLVPFDTVRSSVKNYQTLIDMNGTDKKPSEPLTIEHNYIDRNIPAPLGKDAQPRPTSTVIGGEQTISATSFITEADSNCFYGQGGDLSLGLGSIFAKVYVTQRPTPLSADLLAYLATLTKAGSENGLDVYVEPKTDGGGFFTGIVTDIGKGVVVFVKASSKEFAEAATVAASETLAQAPKAPMNLTYPLAWSKMPNPCTLLSANDFATATGKPAGPLANDAMILNEVGGRVMQRTCERLEVERLDGTPIAKSNITIRLAADETAAKQYVETIKNNKDQYSIQPLKQRIRLADDAYTKTVLKDGKPVGYEFDMRIGNAIIVLAVDAEQGLDASADAFAARILPLARAVADKYE